jgi:FkbM family methyltransferase
LEYDDFLFCPTLRALNMTWKRALIHILDNRSGRPLLGVLATARAKQLLREDVEIGYDAGWHHRVGPYFVPDGPRFDYYEPTVLAWKNEVSTFFRDATEFWFREYKPKAGDIVVDIGAGRGEDVLPFANEVGPTGRVVAVEAHPTTYGHLKRFCQLNRLSNVLAIHAAVMDTPGSVAIDDGVSWLTNTVRTSGEGNRVRATTVDRICREHRLDRIDFLKMNIEGAEARALLGMRDTISKIQSMCVCCHDFRADRGHGEEFRTRDFVTEFLKSSGFTVSRRSSDPRDFVRDHLFGVRAQA